MSLDPSTLEAQLQGHRAANLDQALLARLEACAADTWTDLQAAEIRFQASLQQFAPAPLPAALLASLETTLGALPFPGDLNIVAFPHPDASRPGHAQPRHRSRWSTAAAAATVALAGAAAALWMPTTPEPDPSAAVPPPPPPRVSPPSRNSEPLIPAGFDRGLTEARDEGVIWQPNNQPHRVLKVIYSERVTLKDAAGLTYQVEQPRVEYILVPAKTD